MVFVLDKHQKPLMPCSEKRARQLLERGRAIVHKIAPFTIRLKDRTVEASAFQPLRVKLDPGSKTTGVAVILDGAKGTKIIFFGEIVHKTGIKARLDARRNVRHGRRFRHTRYRKPRFQNRKRKAGWLPPSLEARVNQTLYALAKIRRLAPITALSTEHVKFDTQQMQNPLISGVEYQQGTLLGYEIREYLLEKWDRQCAYCDARDVDLQIDHVYPKALGGSDRVSNLVIACPACNASKNNRLLADFLAHDPGRRRRVAQNARKVAGKDRAKQRERAQWEATRLDRIQQQLRTPLKDAAMMNATRWRLYEQLQATGLPVEAGSGARTKMQRIQHRLPKEHYFDALCVGASTPDRFTALPAYVHIWTAKGRGNRQRCRTNKYGFPIRYLSGKKVHFGFQTGDRVRADKRQGQNAGVWTGRLTIRTDGRFVVTTADGLRIEVSWRSCRLLQRGDGWQYAQKPANREKGR
ncbi:RNA-guided endonuclease IscB, partial [Sulfobacillus sp. hq2]|uniref:RNA-guided endonuclease IscB n=1 Tax=Sulfobacillus sp. hq2 TaxID=2039167 RepID=UPI000CD1B065